MNKTKNQTGNKFTGCDICSRKSKRICPVLGGSICTACCGTNRGSKLDCPPLCPFFPFGTDAYDQWLKVDGTWFPKALKYVLSRLTFQGFEEAVQRLSMGTQSDEETREESGGVHAVHYFFGVNTDESGRTLADHWEQEGWRGLNNDERVMSKYRRHTLPTIIEIQKTLCDQAMECFDVLDPARGKFLLFDRATAARAVRFTRFLTWITHYPHFCRLAGMGLEVSSHVFEEFSELLAEAVAGEPDIDEVPAAKRHLAENFAQWCDRIGQLSVERRERMVRSLDAYHCRAWYAFQVERSRIAEVLAAKPDFELDEDHDGEPEDPPDTEYYDWLRLGEAKEIERDMVATFRYDSEDDGVGVLGSVRFYADSMMIETLGKKKFVFAKKLVARYFGKRVAFSKEQVDDLSEHVRRPEHAERNEPTSPEPEIPPDVEEQLMAQVYRSHYRKFLEDSIPALDGLTPRQAASEPQMRPRLIELMKSHLHGIEENSRRKGIALDINWVIEELGLDELL
ncbi:MAG: hypothetical protein ABIF77_12820 [bacterium]